MYLVDMTIGFGLLVSFRLSSSLFDCLGAEKIEVMNRIFEYAVGRENISLDKYGGNRGKGIIDLRKGTLGGVGLLGGKIFSTKNILHRNKWNLRFLKCNEIDTLQLNYHCFLQSSFSVASILLGK